jgi:hypothetical protein
MPWPLVDLVVCRKHLVTRHKGLAHDHDVAGLRSEATEKRLPEEHVAYSWRRPDHGLDGALDQLIVETCG